MNTLKKIILAITVILFVSCGGNPNYETNLATAQKLFELHGEEKLDEQLALVSEDIKIYTPMYGSSEPMGYDVYASMLKGYHDNFEDIKYNAQAWLPGVDTLSLKPDGSVRTYGTWTGKNTASGKNFEVLFYHYMTFDENGMIINGGDFGDATGTVVAVSE